MNVKLGWAEGFVMFYNSEIARLLWPLSFLVMLSLRLLLNVDFEVEIEAQTPNPNVYMTVRLRSFRFAAEHLICRCGGASRTARSKALFTATC